MGTWSRRTYFIEEITLFSNNASPTCLILWNDNVPRSKKTFANELRQNIHSSDFTISLLGFSLVWIFLSLNKKKNVYYLPLIFI